MDEVAKVLGKLRLERGPGEGIEGAAEGNGVGQVDDAE
jgi:hypothetical protein